LYIYSKADAVFFITEDDKRYAEAHCSMKHSYVMPTGMLISALPDDKAACKETLRKTYGLSDDTTILIYNGALDYKPNIEALDAILQYINPYLQQQHFKYKILVCGNGLPDSYNKLEAYRDQNIIFCGFVDDITLYFKGADVYLNPMIGGGGIKTRLVESISYNTNAVSTQKGAIGFMNATVEDKVAVVEDNNWPAFAEAVIAMSKKKTADTTKEFYEYYYWTNIVQRFIKQVNAVIS
jgi:glycosyltransferase involved in cell wall biosynthesis